MFAERSCSSADGGRRTWSEGSFSSGYAWNRPDQCRVVGPDGIGGVCWCRKGRWKGLCSGYINSSSGEMLSSSGGGEDIVYKPTSRVFINRDLWKVLEDTH